MKSNPELIDEVFEYVSPIAVAYGGDISSVMSSLALTKSILQTAHPDRGFEYSDSLVNANRLYSSIKDSNKVQHEILTECTEDTVEPLGKLRKADVLNQNIDVLIESITKETRQDTHDVSDTSHYIVPSDVDIDEDSSDHDLSFLLNTKIIDQLKELDGEDLNFVIKQLRKYTLKNQNLEIPDISSSQWSVLFDRIQNGDVSWESLNKSNGEVASVHLKNAEDRVLPFLSLFSPESSYIFPKNWYRSFSGLVYAPMFDIYDYEDHQTRIARNKKSYWQNYKILNVQNGIVVDERQIDYGDRESIQLVDGLPTKKHRSIMELVNDVLKEIGSDDSFLVTNSEKGDQIGPANFVFFVKNQIATVVGTDLQHAKHTINNKIQREDVAIDDGVYMIKAGKPQGATEYDKQNLPLALIKLKEMKIPKRNSYKGFALVGECSYVLDANDDVSTMIRNNQIMDVCLDQKSDTEQINGRQRIEVMLKILLQDSISKVTQSLLMKRDYMKVSRMLAVNKDNQMININELDPYRLTFISE